MCQGAGCKKIEIFHIRIFWGIQPPSLTSTPPRRQAFQQQEVPTIPGNIFRSGTQDFYRAADQQSTQLA